MVVQPKVDGIRCYVRAGDDGRMVAYSRHGKPLANCDHILRELESLPGSIYEWMFDGELFAGTYGKTLQSVRAHERRGDMRLVYCAFDVLPLSSWIACKPTRPLRERMAALSDITSGLKHVRVLPYRLASSHSTVRGIARDYVRDGHEGAVAKYPWESYHYGSRGRGWYKLRWNDPYDCRLKNIDIDGGRIQVVTPRGGLQWVGGMTASRWRELSLCAEHLRNVVIEIRGRGYGLHGQIKDPTIGRFRDC